MGSESLRSQFQAAFDPDSTAKMLALVFGSESVTNNQELSLVDARVLDSRVGLFVEALNLELHHISNWDSQAYGR